MGGDKWFLVAGRMLGWCGYILVMCPGHMLAGYVSGCVAVHIADKLVVRLVI